MEMFYLIKYVQLASFQLTVRFLNHRREITRTLNQKTLKFRKKTLIILFSFVLSSSSCDVFKCSQLKESMSSILSQVQIQS
jgi:hypothetical protein